MRTNIILIPVLLIFYASNSLFSNVLFKIQGNSCIRISLTNDDDDPLNGLKKEYYPNGKIMREYSLKNGQIDGSYKFYNTLGKLVSDQFYKDGEPNGYLKTYYEGGQLKAEMNMKGPNISGSSREFDEDGTLRKESMISGEAPEISSQTTIYYKDGKIQSQITVLNGKLVYSITYDKQDRVTFEDKPGQSISY